MEEKEAIIKISSIGMKARDKATGEIVEAELKGFDNLNVEHYIINGNQNWILSEFSLEFLESDPNPDYWDRLEHQAAIAAMQGMMAHTNIDHDDIVDLCVEFAHALVEKMKEESGTHI